MKRYISDFETTTQTYSENESFVYLASILAYDSDKYQDFVRISDYLDYVIKLSEKESVRIYFHKLEFDGEFILHYLANRYNYSTNKLEKGFFQLSKDVFGKIYSIKLKVHKYLITFVDSKKLLLASVKDIGNIMGTHKQEIDYDIKEVWDHIDDVPKNYREYLYYDTKIVKDALIQFFTIYPYNKLTIGGISLATYQHYITYKKYCFYFKEKLTKKQFDLFKKAYHGGFTFIKPKYRNKTITKKIYYYDYNSLYPSIMMDYRLPYGYAFKKRQTPDDFVLYKVFIKLGVLKKNGLPCIHHKEKLQATKYLEIVRDKMVFYPKDEWEFIKSQYDIDYEIVNKWYFRTDFIFRSFIKKFKYLKETAPNLIHRQYHKTILNNLYGKLGTNYKRTKKVLVFGKPKRANQISYGPYVEKTIDYENDEVAYVVGALAITSYSRLKLYNLIKDHYKHFIYCDTDSVFLTRPIKDQSLLDDNKFGYLKLEETINKMKLLRNKCYMVESDAKTYMKASGLNGNRITDFDNFSLAKKYYRQQAIKVKGGILLKKRIFTL